MFITAAYCLVNFINDDGEKTRAFGGVHKFFFINSFGSLK